MGFYRDSIDRPLSAISLLAVKKCGIYFSLVEKLGIGEASRIVFGLLAWELDLVWYLVLVLEFEPYIPSLSI